VQGQKEEDIFSSVDDFDRDDEEGTIFQELNERLKIK
jgi:hypothetical protein